MNKSQLHDGLVLKQIQAPQARMTLLSHEKTRWLCEYEDGHRVYWSQSHILKYYTLP